jgi:hypothetical protein
MPHHFSLIREALRTDIVAVLEELGETKVLFGAPLKPIRSYPHAVVRSSVERKNVVRQVQETYSFDIELRLPAQDPQVIDRESFLYLWADRLVMRFAPYDGLDVPEAVGPYAGVATLRRVDSVVPQDDKDTDPYCSVRISFSCMATIYQ